MLYKGVGTQHNKEADNALEQTNSTGLGEVEAVHHRTVYVGFDNVRGGEQHRIITDQIIEQAEVPPSKYRQWRTRTARSQWASGWEE